jgi:uncharacterized protein
MGRTGRGVAQVARRGLIVREDARALGCEVNVMPPNPESLAFHAPLGFRRISSLATLDGREVELLTKEKFG